MGSLVVCDAHFDHKIVPLRESRCAAHDDSLPRFPLRKIIEDYRFWVSFGGIFDAQLF